MIDIPLDKLSYIELLKLGSRSKDKRIVDEILARKEEGRPKVMGFKVHDKLSPIQNKLSRLLAGALIQREELGDTKTTSMRFAKHTAKGGWVAWLTVKSEDELPGAYKKISRLRATVEEEKNRFGFCRVYLIPVVNKKDGWEGLKIRLDRGTRLVYEDV